MKANTQEKQISGLNIDASDLSRLFIEFTEGAELPHGTRQGIIWAIRRTIQQGLDRLMQAEPAVTFGQAVRESVDARRHRRPSTVADLKSFTQRMLRFRKMANRPLKEISVEECRELLNEVFGHSAHSYHKAKMIMHSVFHYGQKRKWCEENPVKVIESPPIIEERISILTTKQINALVKVCRQKDFRCMEAAIYLMLWCGIRPGEVRRLRWMDIDPKEKVVYIEGSNSKTGGARAIPLRGEAMKLCLSKNRKDEYIAPRNWNRLWKRLRMRAGLHHWQQDALRHTFASFHLKHFHNLHQLQEEMGHRDSNLLRTRYLNLRDVSSISAARFFNRCDT